MKTATERQKTLLRIFAESPQSPTLDEIAALTNRHRSTVAESLRLLESKGLLRKGTAHAPRNYNLTRAGKAAIKA